MCVRVFFFFECSNKTGTKNVKEEVYNLTIYLFIFNFLVVIFIYRLSVLLERGTLMPKERKRILMNGFVPIGVKMDSMPRILLQSAFKKLWTLMP